MKHIVWMMTVFALLLACSGKDAGKDNAKKDIAIPVEVAKATRGDIDAAYLGSATLEADQEAKVVAKVGGIIQEVLVEEGDRVSEKQVLAKLDNEQYRLEMDRAYADYKKVANEFQRKESMYQKKLVSYEQFEAIKFELAHKKAAYELAKLRFDDSEIKAPISGVVSARFIKKGNMIEVSQPAFQVTRFDQLLAVLYVPERDISKLTKGMPAKISLDTWPGEVFHGSILRINPVVNSSSGTVKVTIAIEDRENRLKPGMFSQVQILYARHADTILVPKESVIIEDSQNSVYIVKDNKVKKTEVKTGYQNDYLVEILENIAAGDVIVTTGQNMLRNEVKVEIVNQEKLSADTPPPPEKQTRQQ